MGGEVMDADNVLDQAVERPQPFAVSSSLPIPAPQAWRALLIWCSVLTVLRFGPGSVERLYTAYCKPPLPMHHAASFQVDVNAASEAEFQALEGIGPTLAQRIVEHRTLHGPFAALDRLTDVNGFGPKRLERLAPLLIVGSPWGQNADHVERSARPRPPSLRHTQSQ